MPDIYLFIDEQQAGPYQVTQVRQLLAEGKVSGDTAAWHQALPEWSTVAQVLASFPDPAFAATPPPYIPPIPAPAPPTPVKKEMNGCLWTMVITAGIILFGLFALGILAGIAIGPITAGIEKAKENASMQKARAIELSMTQYANDHNGAYPDGKTSTEVFQKLIDGKYITDPKIFFLLSPGKVPATSNMLTADNVCYDVTSGITKESSDDVPVVFCTGYNVTYTAGTAATPDSGVPPLFPGLPVADKNGSARFIKAHPDGTVPDFIPANFNPGTATYQQLKP